MSTFIKKIIFLFLFLNSSLYSLYKPFQGQRFSNEGEFISGFGNPNNIDAIRDYLAENYVSDRTLKSLFNGFDFSSDRNTILKTFLDYTRKKNISVVTEKSLLRAMIHANADGVHLLRIYGAEVSEKAVKKNTIHIQKLIHFEPIPEIVKAHEENLRIRFLMQPIDTWYKYGISRDPREITIAHSCADAISNSDALAFTRYFSRDEIINAETNDVSSWKKKWEQLTFLFEIAGSQPKPNTSIIRELSLALCNLQKPSDYDQLPQEDDFKAVDYFRTSFIYSLNACHPERIIILMKLGIEPQDAYTSWQTSKKSIFYGDSIHTRSSRSLKNLYEECPLDKDPVQHAQKKQFLDNLLDHPATIITAESGRRTNIAFLLRAREIGALKTKRKWNQ